MLAEQPQAVDVHIHRANAIGRPRALRVTTGQLQPFVEADLFDVAANVQPASLGRTRVAAAQRQHAALEVPGLAIACKRNVPAHTAVRRTATFDALPTGHELDVSGDIRLLLAGLQEGRRQSDVHSHEIAADAHGERRGFFAAAPRKQEVDRVIRFALDQAGDRQSETLRQAPRVDDTAGTRHHLEPWQVRRRIGNRDLHRASEERAAQRFARYARAVDGHNAVQVGHGRIETLDLRAAVVGDDARRDGKIA